MAMKSNIIMVIDRFRFSFLHSFIQQLQSISYVSGTQHSLKLPLGVPLAYWLGEIPK